MSKYQAKFCKDSKATSKSFEKGDYRGQRKLVAKDQNVENASDYIQSPDGKIKSEPLDKKSAEKLRDDAQSGKYRPEDWNSFNTKQLATKIGKEVGQSALYGAAIVTGIHIAQKSVHGEEIEVEEVVEVAFKTGTDAGIKAAVSGAIKVGCEKGIIKVIPKGTAASSITNMVHIGIENAKIGKKVVDGKLTVKEAMNEIEINTVSTVVGIGSSMAGNVVGFDIGAGVGAIIGSLAAGPAGTIVGGEIGAVVGWFVGGTVGYMAGSEVGRAVTKGAQKIRKIARDTVVNITNCVKEGASRVSSSVSSRFKSLLSW